MTRRPNDGETLLEAATTAFRERDADGRILPSPAWADLTGEECNALFERQWAARTLERAIGVSGVSTTAAAVLDRARRLPQLFD